MLLQQVLRGFVDFQILGVVEVVFLEVLLHGHDLLFLTHRREFVHVESGIGGKIVLLKGLLNERIQPGVVGLYLAQTEEILPVELYLEALAQIC